MADIRFQCPHCDNNLEVDDEGQGTQVACPVCGETIGIPTILPILDAPTSERTRLANKKWRDIQSISGGASAEPKYFLWFAVALTPFTPFLTVLNWFGDIVAGIWLLILGRWTALGIGLAALFLGWFVISLALMPGLLFAVPGMKCLQSGYRCGALFFIFLVNLWQAAIFMIWCLTILYLFRTMADTKSLFPILLWSYGTAISPLQYIGSKGAEERESANERSAARLTAATAVFFVSIAYIVTIVMIFVRHPAMRELAITFVTIVGAGYVLMFGATALEILGIKHKKLTD